MDLDTSIHLYIYISSPLSLSPDSAENKPSEISKVVYIGKQSDPECQAQRDQQLEKLLPGGHRNLVQKSEKVWENVMKCVVYHSDEVASSIH